MVRSDVSLGFGDALDTEPKKVRRCAGARKCHGEILALVRPNFDEGW